MTIARPWKKSLSYAAGALAPVKPFESAVTTTTTTSERDFGEIEDAWRTWEESRKSNIIAALSTFSALFEIDLHSVGHEISISDSTVDERPESSSYPMAECLSYKRFVTMSWISHDRREPTGRAKAPVLHLKHVRSPCVHRLFRSN